MRLPRHFVPRNDGTLKKSNPPLPPFVKREIDQHIYLLLSGTVRQHEGLSRKPTVMTNQGPSY